MRTLSRILRPRLEATAHCDLPCGVYDPAQARIEAESVKAIQEKYQGNDDPEFRSRAIEIKEQRADLVKHHLWVLWTDYFKPPHFEKYPELHELFNKATKKAGGGPAAPSPPPTRPPARSCSTSSRRSTRSSGRRRPPHSQKLESGAHQQTRWSAPFLVVGHRVHVLGSAPNCAAIAARSISDHTAAMRPSRKR